MTSTVPASSNPAIGILGFRVTDMGAQVWSAGGVEDGKQDPQAPSLRFKVDVEIDDVYREAHNVFRFMFNIRVAIVRKDDSTGTHHALDREQRGQLMSRLRNLFQLEGDLEQMNGNPVRPVHLLGDGWQLAGSADSVFKNLQGLLWLSAFSRVGNIEWEQSHGPERLICSYLDKDIIGDMVLKMFSHSEEKWLRGKGLQSLRDMPISTKLTNEDPSNTGHMSSSEAFAVVLMESELRLQLDD